MTDCQPQRLPPASTTASHLGRLCLDCSQPATILSGAANTGLFLQGARCLKQVSRTPHQPAGNFSSIVLQSETPPPFFPLPFMVVRPALQSEPLPSFCRFFSASFTAIASSKLLACLGVRFVEELDLGMVIIIIERE